MAILINTRYNEVITSTALNDKISNLAGKSTKLNGFDVSRASNVSVTISKGKALITGAAIEETSETRTLTIPDNLLSDGTVYAIINYNHQGKSVIFEITNTEPTTDNKLILGKIYIKNGAISEVINYGDMAQIDSIVGIAADNEAATIRNSTPSGFITLGELDFDHMEANENVVKLKSESKAYVHGYEITIPKDTVINVGDAPEQTPREDSVFLEAWKDRDFPKTGKLKWRIRHLANVSPDAGIDLGITNGWATTKYSMATGQGDNEIPLPDRNGPANNYFYYGPRRQLWNSNKDLVDNGLAFCHNSQSYAIPMFNLYRKPSCGKTEPFEYQKNSPKGNYSKFAKLMGEEKVEKVIADNVKGTSVLNLFNGKITDLYAYTKYNAPNLDGSISHKENDTKYLDLIHIGVHLYKPSTQYTAILEVINNTLTYPIYFRRGDERSVVRSSNNNADNAQIARAGELGVFKVKFDTIDNLTDKTFGIYFNGGSSSGTGGATFKLIILEGDWTNKEIPSYFSGLKSLGEQEGNLIEVKNSVLKEGAYDPCTNQMELATFPEVTRTKYTGAIVPTITSNLTIPGTHETTGEEKIVIDKIEGKTLQNLLPKTRIHFNADSVNTGRYTVSNDINYVSLNISEKLTSWAYASVPLNIDFMEPGTVYTVIFDECHGVQNIGFSCGGGCHKLTPYLGPIPSSKRVYRLETYPSFDNLLTHAEILLYMFINMDPGTVVIRNPVILKGDYTNTPLEELPYIEGVQSVGEEVENGYEVEIKSCGKNLYKPWLQTTTAEGLTFSLVGEDLYVHGTCTGMVDFRIAYGGSSDRITKILTDAPVNTKFSLSNNLGLSNFFSVIRGSDAHYYGETYEKLEGDSRIGCFVRFREGQTYKNQLFRIQFEEGSKPTPYEPYKEDILIIPLKEQLRKLPSGVADSIEKIDGEFKIVRRIGKAVFVGDAKESIGTANPLDKTVQFNCEPTNFSNKHGSTVSDRFIYHDTAYGTVDTDYEGCMSYARNNTNLIIFKVNKGRLSSADVPGFKAWLKVNPTTVYYELATPIIEDIPHNYDRESAKTYQLSEPLRSLPNGVKDEIKDGVLIRRCGQVTLNGSESWILEFNLNTALSYNTLVPLKSNDSKIFCDRLPEDSSSYVSTGVRNCYALGSRNIGISLLKSNLSAPDSTGFKAWLQANPVTIVYELATPIEIPLKEVSPQSADFSLKRHLVEGNYLRELPNGVKDTIENGKVKRRVGRVVLNGTENGWVVNGLHSKFGEFKPSGAVNGRGFEILANKLPIALIGSDLTKNPIGICATAHGAIRLRPIDKDDLTVADITKWLSNNPITVLYELATPVEEAITEDSIYTPCHEINSYYGSMYAGQGNNHVYMENSMVSDEVVINTDFRQITGKEIVTDCKYKKHYDGCEDSYTASISSNILNLNSRNVELATSSPVDNITWEEAKSSSRFNPTRVRMKNTFNCNPDTVYTLSNSSGLSMVVKEFDKNGIGVKDHGWKNGPHITFKTIANTASIVLMFRKTGDTPISIKEVLDSKPMLNLGDNPLPYEPCIPVTRYKEYIKQNNVKYSAHQISLTGFNYDEILNKSFDLLLKGEL